MEMTTVPAVFVPKYLREPLAAFFEGEIGQFVDTSSDPLAPYMAEDRACAAQLDRWLEASATQARERGQLLIPMDERSGAAGGGLDTYGAFIDGAVWTYSRRAQAGEGCPVDLRLAAGLLQLTADIDDACDRADVATAAST